MFHQLKSSISFKRESDYSLVISIVSSSIWFGGVGGVIMNN